MDKNEGANAEQDEPPAWLRLGKTLAVAAIVTLVVALTVMFGVMKHYDAVMHNAVMHEPDPPKHERYQEVVDANGKCRPQAFVVRERETISCDHPEHHIEVSFKYAFDKNTPAGFENPWLVKCICKAQLEYEREANGVLTGRDFQETIQEAKDVVGDLRILQEAANWSR